jgi:hypothetical protein
LVNVFNALDLPALDRPAKATSIPESLGKRRISGALRVNAALLKCIFVEDKGLTHYKFSDIIAFFLNIYTKSIKLFHTQRELKGL